MKKIDKTNLGITGLQINPEQIIFVKNKKLGGILRFHNISNSIKIMKPSFKSLKKAGFDVYNKSGLDDFPSHMPVFWNVSDVMVKMIKPNKDMLPNENRAMSQNAISRLMEKEMSMNELLSLIPSIGDNDSKKNTMSHYLGFRRSNMYCIDYQELDNPPIDNSLIINLFTGKQETKGKTIFVHNALLSNHIGFVIPKETLCDVSTTVNFHTHKDLISFLKSIGTSGMISLLQKTIRRKVIQFFHPDNPTLIFSAKNVICSIIDLLLDPKQKGIFIPYPGAYVTARQHMLKRLMIIMVEDSEYIPDSLNVLASGCLLSHKVPQWNPPKYIINRWKEIALDMWKNNKTSYYEKKIKMKPSILNENTLPLVTLYELGGMQGDKNMFSYLLKYPEKRNIIFNSQTMTLEPMTTLDIYMDQHVESRFIWLKNQDMTQGKRDFNKELTKFFKEFTGQNPRRKHNMEIQKENVIIQKQASIMFRNKNLIKSSDKKVRIEKHKDEIFRYQLTNGHLVSLIGQHVVKIRKNKKILVTVSPDNINELIAIPNPSRNAIYSSICDKDKKLAKEKVRQKYIKGFKNKENKIRWDDVTKEWSINGILWDDYRKKEYIIRDYSKVYSMDFDINRKVILFVCSLMNGYKKTVIFPRMNREGKGTHTQLTGWEGHAYQFMLQLAKQYPDALQPIGLFNFISNNVYYRLHIRKQLLGSFSINWIYPISSDKRQLTSEQQLALSKMINSDKKRMGTFLWMLVGSGKTLTVLHFLEKTKRVNKVIWCLPQSAIKSVIKEIEIFGWKHEICVSSLSRKKKYDSNLNIRHLTRINHSIKHGYVTLIEHDDVRNLDSIITPQMIDTAFVYDEVHKAMDRKTLRTTHALKLAKVAGQLICLTGTPIVKSSAYPLIQWLNLCVEFDVNFHNFWVAANSMSIVLKQTKVKTRYQNISVPLTPQQRMDIYKYLPYAMGGSSSSDKADFRKAYTLSRDRVDTHIITLAKKYVLSPIQKTPQCIVDKNIVKLDSETRQSYEIRVTTQLEPSKDIMEHLSQRVLIVSETTSHSKKLVRMLLQENILHDDIITVGGNKTPYPGVKHYKSVHLTEQSQLTKKPRFCVACIQFPEGYTLTWMTIMITGVYPSNQAKRTQIEGRINRVSCQRLHRHYIQVMTGLTEFMFKNQMIAKNLESTLRQLNNFNK